MSGSASHRLAVVLVNFNGWQDTLGCVRSLIEDGQAPPVPRLIVVCENGSTNDSAERLAEALPRLVAADDPSLQVMLVDTGFNRGFAGGCNVGLRLAHQWGASHFWLLNNDTEAAAGAGKALMERLDEDATIGLCGSKLVYWADRQSIQARGGATYDPVRAISRHLGVHEPADSPDDVSATEAAMAYVVGASLMLKRHTLETLGWMCEDYFLYFEELDWAHKARTAGLRCGYAPHSVVFHKEGASVGSSHHEGQASALSLRFLAQNRLEFTRRFFPQHLQRVRCRMAFEVLVHGKRREWPAAAALMRALAGVPARKRPRIGIDFHTWDGIFQGSRSHVLGLYRAAIVQAPDLDFVFFLHDTRSLARDWPEFSAPNVTLVSMARLPSFMRLGWQLTWLRLVHRIDVLHMQYRLPLWPAGRTACTQHDLLFETHPQYFGKAFVQQSKWTLPRSARQTDALFTVSEFSRREIHRLYGIALDKIAVTVNGVDGQRFHPKPGGEPVLAELGLASGGYFINVGRIEPRKNQALLIRSWVALGPAAPALVLVGQRDTDFTEVEDCMSRLGAADRSRLHWLSGVSDEVLPSLMRHALALVYPAWAEGFGMPVAEAMASGVAVITSDTTALPEIAGHAALLVSPEDETGLTAAMQRLLDDPQQVLRMQAAGVIQARLFDWQASARVLLGRLRALF